MTALILARIQFGLTLAFHFFFLPISMGLSLLVLVMEAIYAWRQEQVYRRMAQFFGHLFTINFAVGIVTGLIQEFQFGMNWSEFSRFSGAVIGIPLAVEALLAFFMESVFLGVWGFGWEKFSAKVHAALMGLVALGANLSAFWILVANSWMQHPRGHGIEGDALAIADFGIMLSNPYLWQQFPHTLLAAFATTAFLVLGISAYHLRRGQAQGVFLPAAKMGIGVGLAASLLLAFTGHSYAQTIEKLQPMKLAAMEALWESEEPAGFSLLAVIDPEARENPWSIEIPYLLSLLALNSFEGEVLGLNQLEAEMLEAYGPGDYLPPVVPVYWSFRVMVGLGLLLIFLSAWGAWLWRQGKLTQSRFFLILIPWAIPLPYLANTAGWLVAELGRQPFVIYALMRSEEGVSPGVGSAEILLTLSIFTLLYLALIITDIVLLARAARNPPQEA